MYKLSGTCTTAWRYIALCELKLHVQKVNGEEVTISKYKTSTIPVWERNTRRKDFLTITYAKDYSVQKYQKQDSYTILQQNVCKYIQDNLWTIAACNGSGYEMYQVSYNWMKHFGQMGFISLRKKKTIWTPPPAPSFTVSLFAVSYRWLKQFNNII